MTLTMNGKTINPKAIDQTEDQIISENIEDTMCQLADTMGELSDAYDGLCELLADAGMDTKNAEFTLTDRFGRTLTLKGKNVGFVNDLSDKIWEAMIQFNGGEDDFLVDNNLHEMAIAIAQSLNKSTVEAVYTAMLQFHDGPGSECESPDEFYYNMAKAIVDSMSKQ